MCTNIIYYIAYFQNQLWCKGPLETLIPFIKIQILNCEHLLSKRKKRKTNKESSCMFSPWKQSNWVEFEIMIIYFQKKCTCRMFLMRKKPNIILTEFKQSYCMFRVNPWILYTNIISKVNVNNCTLLEVENQFMCLIDSVLIIVCMWNIILLICSITYLFPHKQLYVLLMYLSTYFLLDTYSDQPSYVVIKFRFGDFWTAWHRWELPLLYYHIVRKNYPYPFLWIIFWVILHGFIWQNYHKNSQIITLFSSLW